MGMPGFGGPGRGPGRRPGGPGFGGRGPVAGQCSEGRGGDRLVGPVLGDRLADRDAGILSVGTGRPRLRGVAAV